MPPPRPAIELTERRAVHVQHQAEHERLSREAAARARAHRRHRQTNSRPGRAAPKRAERQHAAFRQRRDDLTAEIAELERRPAEIAEQRERLAETIA